MSQSTTKKILDYLFSLESFRFEPCYNIQLPLVKQYYEIYSQHTKSKSFSMISMSGYTGLRLEKKDKKFNMALWFSYCQQLEGICSYLGPQIETLRFVVDEYYCRRSQAHIMLPGTEDNFALILRNFTSLKELSLKGIDPSLCKDFRAISTLYESLRKFKFDITSAGNKAFFTHLCSRMPNVTHVELNMTRNEDIMRPEVVHMPTTDFEELSIQITRDDRPDWKEKRKGVGLNSYEYNGPHVNECVNIAVTDKNGFSDIFVFGITLYQANTCSASGDGKKNFRLKEKSIYDIDEGSEGCNTVFNLHIVCNSIKKFKIDTLYNTFTLNMY